MSAEEGLPTITVPQGMCLAFGGTNARVATCAEGDIREVFIDPTPQDGPDAFFRHMARKMLQGAEAGSEWMVAGLPGPISDDGKMIGPMKNVRGMDEDQFDLHASLSKADRAAGRLLSSGFVLLTVNDGPLAAHAVANRVSEGRFERPAALIVGSGVGAGLVKRDPQRKDLHRLEEGNLDEIGHIVLRSNPANTFETTYSGPAIARRFQALSGLTAKAEDIPAGHAIWKDEGEGIAQMAHMLGLVRGAELVVPTGGVGAGAYEKYASHMERALDLINRYGNTTQQFGLPVIERVPAGEADVFELYGAEGVVREHFANRLQPAA